MSFIWKWFWDVLEWIGFSNKNASIILLGLDNAGKTTLLHMLRDNKMVLHEPTRHPTHEELMIGNVKFTAHDLGGHAAARRLWKDYFAVCQGVVFMIDAADVDRFDEARTELHRLLSTEQLAKTPFCVMGNKIDARGAVSERELREAMSLLNTTGKDNFSTTIRPIEVFMVSVLKKTGYADGFRWLAKFCD